MATVEPTPRAVSEEDRRAAIEKLRQTKCVSGDGVFYRASTAEASKIIAALVSHGWGPKPTVSAKRLDRLVTFSVRDNSLSHLVAYLTQVGIEVTDG